MGAEHLPTALGGVLPHRLDGLAVHFAPSGLHRPGHATPDETDLTSVRLHPEAAAQDRRS